MALGGKQRLKKRRTFSHIDRSALGHSTSYMVIPRTGDATGHRRCDAESGPFGDGRENRA
eukprot:201166-Prymnesium_polylepis.1